MITLAALMGSTAQQERSASVPNPGAGATVFVFYVVGNAWFLYAYLRCFLYALRYARHSRGSLAAACGTVALGLLASALTSVLRLGIVGARQLGVPEPRIRSPQLGELRIEQHRPASGDRRYRGPGVGSSCEVALPTAALCSTRAAVLEAQPLYCGSRTSQPGCTTWRDLQR